MATGFSVVHPLIAGRYQRVWTIAKAQDATGNSLNTVFRFRQLTQRLGHHYGTEPRSSEPFSTTCLVCQQSWILTLTLTCQRSSCPASQHLLTKRRRHIYRTEYDIAPNTSLRHHVNRLVSQPQ